MAIKAEEISALIKEQIENYQQQLVVEEVEQSLTSVTELPAPTV